MLPSLAFLPLHEVAEGLALVRNALAEWNAESVADYFFNTYVRPNARFPPKFWVISDLVHARWVNWYRLIASHVAYHVGKILNSFNISSCSSNNRAEGLNRGAFGHHHPHPPFHQVVEILMKEAKRSRRLLQRARDGLENEGPRVREQQRQVCDQRSQFWVFNPSRKLAS